MQACNKRFESFFAMLIAICELLTLIYKTSSHQDYSNSPHRYVDCYLDLLTFIIPQDYKHPQPPTSIRKSPHPSLIFKLLISIFFCPFYFHLLTANTHTGSPLYPPLPLTKSEINYSSWNSYFSRSAS